MFEEYCINYYGEEGLTSTMFIIDSKNYDAALENAKEFESLWLVSKETDVGLWNSVHYIKAELQSSQVVKYTYSIQSSFGVTLKEDKKLFLCFYKELNGGTESHEKAYKSTPIENFHISCMGKMVEQQENNFRMHLENVQLQVIINNSKRLRKNQVKE